MDAREQWSTIQRMMVGDFNPNHDDLGRFASGSRAINPGGYVSPETFGLKREQGINIDEFRFFDLRFGSYARRLAEEYDEYVDDGEIFSFQRGENKAYAGLDDESDSLEIIVSTGGGAGTDLLKRILQYQKARGRRLIWYADNKESNNYYRHLGLNKYSSGNDSSRLYEIPAEKMEEAIGLLNERT